MRRVLPLALLTLALYGCRTTPAVAPASYKVSGRSALLASHNANAAAISTLSADLRIKAYIQKGAKLRVHGFSACLDLERPSRVRLVHDALGRGLFYVLSDGKRFWIGLDGALAGEKDTLYTGELAALRESEYFLRPDRLLGIFALPKLPPANNATTLFAAYPDRYVFHFVENSPGPALSATAVFSRVDLKLTELELFDRQGRLAVKVDYQTYQAVNGTYLPKRLHITWPLEDIAFVVKLSKPKVGEPIDQRFWQYRWRDDIETVQVE